MCEKCHVALLAEARVEELERRLADKDASIQQLIEDLQQAEAQNAAVARTDAHE